MVIPSYWKRPRVLIIGCGDIGQRVATKLPRHYTVLGLYRRPEVAEALRDNGIRPLAADLDDIRSLKRIGGLARYILHFAPPPGVGEDDQRTRRLLSRIRPAAFLPTSARHPAQRAPRRGFSPNRWPPHGVPPHGKRAIVAPARLLYISTSGVYGDCAGAVIDETRPLNPQSERAKRRVAAEKQIRRLGRSSKTWSTTILRVPGIHGPDRLPLQRLRGGQPVMRPEEDSWGNHIDADDLADAVIRLLPQRRSQRVYHVCDGEPLPMGVYLNRLTQALGLPPLPQLSRSEAQAQLSPSLWSFQRESRRMSNRRILAETRWRPKIADLDSLIRAIPKSTLE